MRNRWTTLGFGLVACIAGCGNDAPAPVGDGATAAQAAETSHLSVASLPAGEVLIDGKAVGTTPVDKAEVAAGARTITVRRKGFTDWTGKVTAEPGKTETIAATLVAIDPTDPETIKVMESELDIEPVDVEPDETFRSSSTPPPVTVTYPRGDVIATDLDEFRIDVTEAFEHDGVIDFRIGD